MENELFIPQDYTELVKHYRNLKKELNDLKQTLYETSRQLKVNEALLTEYQSDIELSQNREQLQNQKHEAKITSLEDIIANLRSAHSENILYLEAELAKKEKEIDNFNSEIKILKYKDATEVAVDDSTNSSEIIALANENELLQEKIRGMEEAFLHIQKQNNKLEETLEEYKEELTQVKESLTLKKEELLENTTLIEKLNDELLCAQRELENYKYKPLEADSKGNSLFAEVDDRRIHLQETINQMKSRYVHLKQEHGHHVKLISQLRKENADLRESWKKDLEEIQEDKFWVNDTLKRHVQVLEELLEDYKKQLEERSLLAGNELDHEFQFYHEMINDKSNKIEEWKKKYSDKSINEHLMSVNLAEANKKVRLLRLEVQQQEEELKEVKANIETQEEDKTRAVCHKCTTRDQGKSKRFEVDENRKVYALDDGKSIKSCLKQSNPKSEDDLTLTLDDMGEGKREGDFSLFNNPYIVGNRRKGRPLDNTSNITVDPVENPKFFCPNTTEDVHSFEDKENITSNVEPTGNQEKRGVTFSENTVEPVTTSGRRRATRVFIANKKN